MAPAEYSIEPLTIDAGGLTLAGLACGNEAAADRPLVLCVHGFPDTAHTWNALLPRLAAAGYRAVAPFLRGYPPSGRPPNSAYDAPSIARDMLAWADALGAREFHIVGHDWGAITAYTAALFAPERVRSFVAAAVPPMPRFLANMRTAQLRRSWYMFFFQLPGIAEKALARNDFALVDRLWHDWSPGWVYRTADIAPVKAALATPESRTAALGYYRALRGLLTSPKRLRSTMAQRIGVPALVVAGLRDGCIGPEMFDGTPDCFTSHCQMSFMDAGHFMHRERPDAFETQVLDFLSRH